MTSIKTVFFLLFSLLGISASAQEEMGNWMMYFGLNRLNEQWSLHTEAQWRNHTIKPDLEQLLLRTGFNYHLKQDIMLSAGYAYISSHPFDESVGSVTRENRLWQQIIMRNKWERLHIEHRYRIEQRFVDGDFSQRFRYRLFAAVPLNKTQMETGAFFLAWYDEVFLVPESGRVFDRNRLYGAVGYQLSASLQLQTGLLRQSTNTFSKDYLQFAIFFNPDFRRSSLP